MKKRFIGFTLIELLVVIAIISMLIGILVPALSAARITALKAQNAVHVRGITHGLILYADASNDRFPDGDVRTRFQTLVDPAAGQGIPTKTLICPFEHDAKYKAAGGAILVADPNTVVNYSYALLDRNNPEWRSNSNPAAVLVSDRKIGAGSAWDTRAWRGTVGYGEGHVEFVNSPVLSTVIAGVSYSNDDLFASVSNDTMMYHMGN